MEMALMPKVATRLILTNLPPTLTTLLLKRHLQNCPPTEPIVTDIKVLLKPDGTSRRIAFIGFREHNEAERVRAWCDGSWVNGERGGGCRIKVDWAKEAKDLPPPRKKVKHESNATDHLSKNSLPDSKAASSTTSDEAIRFQEFMSVMAPKTNLALNSEAPDSVPTSKSVSKMKNAGGDPSLSSIPRIGLSSTSGTANGKDDEDENTLPIIFNPEDVEKEKKIIAPSDGAAEDEEISDMEYLRRRMSKRKNEEDGDDRHQEEDLEEDDDTTIFDSDIVNVVEIVEPEKIDDTKDERKKNLDIIEESRRLFIRNLAFSTTSEDLQRLLEPFGEIEQLHIPLDTSTRTSKGLAYVTYTSSTSAIQAFEELDKSTFQGRLLHVLPAIGRRIDQNKRSDALGGVKGDRMEQKKKEAGQGLSWATMYMNSDAVVSSIADRFNIPKSELLNPTDSNAAVKVALAESHVIAESKRYFEENGVNLQALGSISGPRSSTTILVKNIPYGTSSATLSGLFTPSGNATRLLMPPAGTMAIVEMNNASEANDAWRGLVYKKVGSSVLYLEKGPAGIWLSPVPTPGSAKVPTGNLKQNTSSTVTDGALSNSEAGSTLFIKNLSFNSTTASLTNTFSHFPNFVFATVSTKPDPKHPGQTLSMGFGFVGFKTVDSAKEAMKARMGYLLDGHQLEIKFAQRGREASESDAGGNRRNQKDRKSASSTSTKLIVKNLPFEITRKEIRELFSAYGTLKSVRLPKKYDQKTRGFAFLDFASHRDAESAFKALEHSHILGRHLIIQWAEDNGENGASGLDAAKQAIGLSKSKLGKKSKFVIGDSSGGGVLDGGNVSEQEN